MSCRFVALLLGLLLATTAMASDGLPLPNACRRARSAMPPDALVQQLNTSSRHASLLADAGDGRLNKLRRELAAMPHEDAVRWRQSAMMFAVEAGQPDVVAAMLGDGADASASALLPGYREVFRNRALSPAIQNAFAPMGSLNDRDTTVGPALAIAASCGDVAIVDTLLLHHAHVMARSAPNVADALQVAVLHGDVAIVKRLLDHGANVCAEDRHSRQRALDLKRHFTPLAELGRRAGLPSDLTAQLACSAVASLR